MSGRAWARGSRRAEHGHAGGRRAGHGHAGGRPVVFASRTLRRHTGATGPSPAFAALGPFLPHASHPSHHTGQRGHPTHDRGQPAPLPPARGRHHRVHRPVGQHRAGRGAARQPPHRDDRGRRAHRRPDAGEPVLRPLLRRAPRRPRLRRPAPREPAERQVRVAPARRRGGAAALPPGGRRPRHAVPGGTAAQLARRAGGLQRRKVRPVGPRQGHHDDGVPDPRGHPVPLRARRRVHRLRRLPLLVHRLHRPQPLLPVVRAHRQRRQGRRPGPRQRRARLRLDDLPRAPGEGRDLLEDLPGRRRRPGRGRLLGLDTRRLPRQLRRQLPAVLRQVPHRAPRRPAVRQGPHGHGRQER